MGSRWQKGLGSRAVSSCHCWSQHVARGTFDLIMGQLMSLGHSHAPTKHCLTAPQYSYLIPLKPV